METISIMEIPSYFDGLSDHPPLDARTGHGKACSPDGRGKLRIDHRQQCVQYFPVIKVILSMGITEARKGHGIASSSMSLRSFPHCRTTQCIRIQKNERGHACIRRSRRAWSFVPSRDEATRPARRDRIHAAGHLGWRPGRLLPELHLVLMRPTPAGAYVIRPRGQRPARTLRVLRDLLVEYCDRLAGLSVNGCASAEYGDVLACCWQFTAAVRPRVGILVIALMSQAQQR